MGLLGRLLRILARPNLSDVCRLELQTARPQWWIGFAWAVDTEAKRLGIPMHVAQTSMMIAGMMNRFDVDESQLHEIRDTPQQILAQEMAANLQTSIDSGKYGTEFTVTNTVPRIERGNEKFYDR